MKKLFWNIFHLCGKRPCNLCSLILYTEVVVDMTYKIITNIFVISFNKISCNDTASFLAYSKKH